MDTTLALPPSAAASAIPYALEQRQAYADDRVPPPKALDGISVIPSDKAFVAQVVNARLSGTAFPENPGEIAPPERTLKPYNVPMLPFEKEEPALEATEEDDSTVTDVANKGKEDQEAAPVTPISATPELAAPTADLPGKPKREPVELKQPAPAPEPAQKSAIKQPDEQ
ncbi:hypothetical protein [Yoonia sediminilitoris]|uniref:Uncharacterized protein n=1 Tax=Yoonia sediminilitoris TaxID=1286148 RepID=A0A2T6KQQ7_9RHOB|nr:hypothetical protein [Yoonia sediminilitoris]PUB18882.1 hypothetical protein C8N45_101473 [Yoonia sediminilitoris]RCW99050.1 hypothetical protein DFP92_101473 [Yoonia sediminilitoris]